MVLISEPIYLDLEMVSNWLDFVAFDVITFAAAYSKEKIWNQQYFTIGEMRLDGGGSIQFEDPGIKALFKAVGFKDFTDSTKITEMGDRFRSWNTRHQQAGPGQSDMSPVSEFREACEKHGWEAVDDMMSSLWDVVPSQAFAIHRVCYNPTDEGLGGAQCYSLGIHVKSSFPGRPGSSVHYNDKWRVLGSDSEMVLRSLVETLHNHHVTAKSENLLNQVSRYRSMADSGTPYKIELKNNGKSMLTIEVSENNDKTGIDIKWNTAKLYSNDRQLMEVLADIAPARDAFRIKGLFLEGDLGL